MAELLQSCNQIDSAAESPEPPGNAAPPVCPPEECPGHNDRGQHAPILATAVLIVVLSFVLIVRDDQRVEVLGLPGWPIPESCGMRLLFHRDCPGCGLTRSFVHLAHGDWKKSLEVHRVGWMVALAVLAQFPYRWYLMRRPSPKLHNTLSTWLGGVLITALLLNWVYNAVHSR